MALSKLVYYMGMLTFEGDFCPFEIRFMNIMYEYYDRKNRDYTE